MPSSFKTPKANPKRSRVAQRKPTKTKATASSPPLPSSKKQQVSGGFDDQSIQQLNDVTQATGVDLRAEREQLFSRPKEDSRVPEESRRAVQEEAKSLILQKSPLQKKVVGIMAQSGLKSVSSDVEQCLSLCVEERMRGLIADSIKMSKQQVDVEKPRHKTIITSDIRKQMMQLNHKAREEWNIKQAETEKSQKTNEANKEKDHNMRAIAANVADRAATGVGEMLSKWQSMIEAKKHGGPEASFAAGRNQAVVARARARARARVDRSITVKDVITVLERDPQMSRSTLIMYRLYDKIRDDNATI